MNHVEGRLIKMGYSIESINMLSIEDRTYLATGLTNFYEEYYNNPWYTPGGAANYNDEFNMDDPRIQEILNRLTKIENDIKLLKEVAYDNISVNKGILDLTDVK